MHRRKHNKRKDDRMKEIIEYSENLFDSIKHIDDYGNEYWLAR